MRRIVTMTDIEEGLDALCALDPRLVAVRAAAGDVPLRLSPPGFESLISIVIGQQVSRASAAAIHGRLVRLVVPLTPAAMIEASEAVHREAGMSRAKQKTTVALARAVAEEGLDLHALCDLEAEAAIAALTKVSGIGPWTAQCYLLFAAGHPDVFPAGDVALQSAVGDAFGVAPRPGGKALAAIAESWSPWRGVAARLFWAYYREMRGRDAIPVAPQA